MIKQFFNQDVILFFFFFFILLLTTPLGIGGDSQLIYLTVQNLFKHGDFFQTLAPDGTKQYCIYGLLLGIYLSPFYLMGKLLTFFTGMHELIDFSVGISNPILISLCVYLFFKISTQLGYTSKASFISSCIFLFCSMLWHYSTVIFTEQLTMVLLLSTLYYSLKLSHTFNKKTMIWISILLGISIHSKFVNAVTIGFPFFFFNIYILYKHHQSSFRNILIFTIPLFLSVILHLCINYYKFGIVQFSYAKTTYYIIPEALYGHVFSSGRSLFLYNLPLIYCVFYWKDFIKKHQELAYLIISSACISLFIFSPTLYWHGGGSWGSRYLLPLLALLFIPITFIIDRWPLLTKKIKICFIITIGISATLQLTSILFNNTLQWETILNNNHVTEQEKFFIPRYSPAFGCFYLAWKSMQDHSTQAKSDTSGQFLSLTKKPIPQLWSIKLFQGESYEHDKAFLNKIKPIGLLILLCIIGLILLLFFYILKQFFLR